MSTAQALKDRIVAADVSTVEGCAAVADAARKQLGCIDIAVHLVGGSSSRHPRGSDRMPPSTAEKLS
jgi:NAD(P)-dependent dehydrogenase (short-subunit alcohol dehydrogenase family)